MKMDIYKQKGRWFGAPTIGLERSLLDGQRFVVVNDCGAEIGDTLTIRETTFRISHIAKPYPWNPEDVVPTGGITLSLVIR